MPASTFTHPAMFSGDFTITEKSVAMSGPYGWFFDPKRIAVGRYHGQQRGSGRSEFDGFHIDREHPQSWLRVHPGWKFYWKEGRVACNIDLRSRFCCEKEGSLPGAPKPNKNLRECLRALWRDAEGHPRKRGSRLEVVVKFNGYDEQLGRPIYTDNHVPFSLKCVILSKPHLKNTQKLYRCGRMVFVWGKLVGWHDAQHMAVVSIDEVSLPNGYQGSPNRLDLGNPVASSMHTWATQWQHVHVDDDDLSELDENGHSPPPVLADRSDSDCKFPSTKNLVSNSAIEDRKD
ncbi:hypothetical protein KEM48_000398 [Puccinia striiformis f. sp. tritici PST-130]|nr:hypothetical protein KEM48_000398 [Puccinia striiformis f. sp. tritici PST-130]